MPESPFITDSTKPVPVFMACQEICGSGVPVALQLNTALMPFCPPKSVRVISTMTGTVPGLVLAMGNNNLPKTTSKKAALAVYAADYSGQEINFHHKTRPYSAKTKTVVTMHAGHNHGHFNQSVSTCVAPLCESHVGHISYIFQQWLHNGELVKSYTISLRNWVIPF